MRSAVALTGAVCALALLSGCVGAEVETGHRGLFFDRTAGLQHDVLQLAVLLYLTGGLQNPFSILILAPVTVAATILSRRAVIALSLLAVAAISVSRTPRATGASSS